MDNYIVLAVPVKESVVNKFFEKVPDAQDSDELARIVETALLHYIWEDGQG